MKKIIISIACLFFLSACATLPKPEQIAEAESVLSKLQNKNSGLKTIKGIGNIRFNDFKIMQSSRVAWLGSKDGNLRIGLLTMTGQPATSITYNGQYLYFFSHFDRQYHKQQTQSPDLDRLLMIPMKTSDLIFLLMGRAPVCKYRGAKIVKDDNGQGEVLVLQNDWGNVVEKIYLSENRNDFSRIEMTDRGGVTYKAELSYFKDIDGFNVPSVIAVSGKKAEFSLAIDRYMPNASIAPDMFVLLPPE